MRLVYIRNRCLALAAATASFVPFVGLFQTSPRRTPPGGAGPAPTFQRDIAPILVRHCVPCHRSGEVAPFPLQSYQDARKRARQIAIVTGSRFMPPGNAETDFKLATNANVLTEHEIALLKRWADTGMSPGHLVETPGAAPGEAAGGAPQAWRLGKPDLVVEMPRAYELPASTPDVYRSFVIPLELPEDRRVRAVEFLPDNPRILRYAALFIDTTGKARRLQSLSHAAGYSAFEGGLDFSTAGSLADWAPGVAPQNVPEGVARLLPKGADLVMLLRFQPDGKPEAVRAQVGLYFAGPSPTVPLTLRLGSRELYLQPGKKARVVDSFVCPTDVQVLRIVPCLHKSGRQLKAVAELPDGARRTLLRIDDWDANWKRPYLFGGPARLPAGTRITMELQFDNSPENPRYPGVRPHHVIPGVDAMEEMASLWIEVVPERPGDQAVLARALAASRPPAEITQSGRYIKQ